MRYAVSGRMFFSNELNGRCFNHETLSKHRYERIVLVWFTLIDEDRRYWPSDVIRGASGVELGIKLRETPNTPYPYYWPVYVYSVPIPLKVSNLKKSSLFLSWLKEILTFKIAGGGVKIRVFC